MAHYWTGGVPTPHPVREIISYGAMVAAPDVYYPGTTVRRSLEDTAAKDRSGEGPATVGVWGKVIRNIPDGFCVEFVFESRAKEKEFIRFLKQVSLEES